MANSRLYVYDPDTNTAVVIGKTMGSGWHIWGGRTEGRLNAFYEGLDKNKGWGAPERTDLKLLTEQELPKGVKFAAAS
jgi:hypothetical protein